MHINVVIRTEWFFYRSGRAARLSIFYICLASEKNIFFIIFGKQTQVHDNNQFVICNKVATCR